MLPRPAIPMGSRRMNLCPPACEASPLDRATSPAPWLLFCSINHRSFLRVYASICDCYFLRPALNPILSSFSSILQVRFLLAQILIQHRLQLLWLHPCAPTLCTPVPSSLHTLHSGLLPGPWQVSATLCKPQQHRCGQCSESPAFSMGPL